MFPSSGNKLKGERCLRKRQSGSASELEKFSSAKTQQSPGSSREHCHLLRNLICFCFCESPPQYSHRSPPMLCCHLQPGKTLVLNPPSPARQGSVREALNSPSPLADAFFSRGHGISSHPSSMCWTMYSLTGCCLAWWPCLLNYGLKP